MFDALATLLQWFYEVWPSYGMAIVFLTLTIMILLTPLTLKGTRSMMVMQALQPEMKKIQQRYKDDRQKLNEELLAFYRENKINPLGGCLPLLIQMPVFLVLYRVLQGLTHPRLYGVVLGVLGAGRAGFDPDYLDPDSKLYHDLAGSGEMVSFGMDLSNSATQAVRESFGSSFPYLLLIAGVTFTSYYQQKQVQGRNPNASQINPQQQMLLRIMPLFFAFISLNLPAALVVYFFVSNCYRVAQQAFISHRIYKPAVASGMFETTGREADEAPAKGKGTLAARGADKEAAAAPERPSGGFFDRLLGGATPRLGSSKPGNGAKGTTPAPAKATGKGNGRASTRATSNRALSPRPTAGRTTPAGSGPQPRARKKKKRK